MYKKCEENMNVDIRWKDGKIEAWYTLIWFRFPTVSSTRYNCLPDISISHTSDASNPKKKYKQLQHVNHVTSLVYVVIVSDCF